jgi:hypothetical protein
MFRRINYQRLGSSGLDDRGSTPPAKPSGGGAAASHPGGTGAPKLMPEHS